MLQNMDADYLWIGSAAFIGQFQGHLHHVNNRKSDASKLSIWMLEDYSGGEWIFKYNISTSQLFGSKTFLLERDYILIAIHPECNLIFCEVREFINVI